MIRWMVKCPSCNANADSFILAEPFNDPRNARVLSVYPRKCSEAADAFTNDGQSCAYRKEFALASSFGLTDGNEMFPLNCRSRWIAPSGTNEGGQGWGIGRDVKIREIPLAFSIRTSSPLEAREERGKKETRVTRQLANICHHSLHLRLRRHSYSC